MACFPKLSQNLQRKLQILSSSLPTIAQIYSLLLTAVDKFEIGISSIETERTPHRRAATVAAATVAAAAGTEEELVRQ